MRNDPEYINVFGKLRKKSGSLEAKDRRNRYYKYKGIGIDIFAIEETNRFAATIAKFLYHNIQYPTSYITVGCIRRPLVRIIEFLHFCILFPVLRLIGKINPGHEYHYVLGTGWPRHTFNMKNTLPLAEAEFEGRRFPVPKNTDAYLTSVFGDWRSLPSEDLIIKSIHCKEYRDEVLYNNGITA
jgi:lipopolysaccharide cholinephosphotransferase